MSPRIPIRIDPATNDVVQSEPLVVDFSLWTVKAWFECLRRHSGALVGPTKTKTREMIYRVVEMQVASADPNILCKQEVTNA